jgi:DNA-binding transcriptional ArsR family regulator
MSRYKTMRTPVRALVLAALVDGPLCARQLTARLGERRQQIHRVLKHLHEVERAIYVVDWGTVPRHRVGPMPTALYALGDKPDAVKPPPTPKVERDRRHRARGRTLERLFFTKPLASVE